MNREAGVRNESEDIAVSERDTNKYDGEKNLPSECSSNTRAGKENVEKRYKLAFHCAQISINLALSYNVTHKVEG